MNTYAIYFSKLSVRPLKLRTSAYAIYFSKLSVRPLKLRTSAYAIYFSKLSVPPISKNYFSNYSEIIEYHVAQSIFQNYPPRIILTALLRFVEKEDPWFERKQYKSSFTWTYE